MFHITSLREGTGASFADLISCCEALLDMMEEFSVFHKSKVIGSKIIEINRLEENGDRLYMEAMHRLYINPTSSMKPSHGPPCMTALKNAADGVNEWQMWWRG